MAYHRVEVMGGQSIQGARGQAHSMTWGKQWGHILSSDNSRRIGRIRAWLDRLAGVGSTFGTLSSTGATAEKHPPHRQRPVRLARPVRTPRAVFLVVGGSPSWLDGLSD
jgi:hypothetical protein